MKPFQLLGAALLGLTSAGCSHTCNLSGIDGRYQMRAGSDSYELSLSTDRVGALTLNGTQVEALSWELEPSNRQVFIHISRASIELLKRLAGEPKIPSDSAQWKSGYFGLMPICGLSGKAKRLELDVDGQHSFSRVK
jgi:hypothetical protein